MGLAKITRIKQGEGRWPSGTSKPLALLSVTDEWVIAVFGCPLGGGVEDGLGPWVGAGGNLPSGAPIEMLKYELDPQPYWQLYTDFQALTDSVLNEFLSTTDLSSDAVVWRRPT